MRHSQIQLPLVLPGERGQVSRAEVADPRLRSLVERASSCQLCPRMLDRRPVLGPQCGDICADVLFVAEAPGRLGADRTQIPLCGDVTGDNFARLLALTRWGRSDVFVTNAVLCNPRDSKGRNAAPTPGEIRNCSGLLRATIQMVDPRFVVTLGATALHAASLVEPHSLSLRECCGRPVSWCGRTLVPLYHPGPRALIHRSFAQQSTDYQALRLLVDTT